MKVLSVLEEGELDNTLDYDGESFDEKKNIFSDISDDEEDNIIVIVKKEPKPLHNSIVKLVEEANSIRQNNMVVDKGLVQVHLSATNSWIYQPCYSSDKVIKECATKYLCGGELIPDKFLNDLNVEFAQPGYESIVIDKMFLVISHSQEEVDNLNKACIAPLGLAVALCQVTCAGKLVVKEVATTQLAHGIANLYGHFNQIISLIRLLKPNITTYIYYPESWGDIYRSAVYSFNKDLISMRKINLIKEYSFDYNVLERTKCPMNEAIHPRACPLCNLVITLKNIAKFATKRTEGYIPLAKELVNMRNMNLGKRKLENKFENNMGRLMTRAPNSYVNNQSLVSDARNIINGISVRNARNMKYAADARMGRNTRDPRYGRNVRNVIPKRIVKTAKWKEIGLRRSDRRQAQPNLKKYSKKMLGYSY